jgi:hypothetical protein
MGWQATLSERDAVITFRGLTPCVHCARQQGLGRARYWRALGFPNLVRARARMREIREQTKAEAVGVAGPSIIELLRRRGD